MSQPGKTGNKQTLLVVVWEWENKQGRWRPYSPEVTQQLERAFGKNLRSVFLGDADPTLKDYCVILSSLQQKCSLTGEVVNVRRNLYPQYSAAGQGAVWQWAGDISGDWRIYDMSVQCVLEESWTSGAQSLDLSETFPGCPYIIYFCNLSQKNKKTGFIRSIRRKTQAAYPIGRPITPQQSAQSKNVHSLLSSLPVCPPQIPIYDENMSRSRNEQTVTKGLFNKVLHFAGNSSTTCKNFIPQPSICKEPLNFRVRRPPKPLPRYFSATPIPKTRTRFSRSPNEYCSDGGETLYSYKTKENSYRLLGSNTTIDSDCSSSHTNTRRPSIETISTYLSQESFNDDNNSMLSYGSKPDTLINFNDSSSDDDVFLVDQEVKDVMSRQISNDFNLQQQTKLMPKWTF